MHLLRPHSKAVLPDGAGRIWVMLVLAAVLPLLLFASWIGVYYAGQDRAHARRLASNTVERVVGRIAVELAGQIEVAQALAASSALDNDNLQEFRLEATRILALHPLWRTIELADPSGAQVVNMLRADGQSLGPTADLDSFHLVIRTNMPAIGGIGPVGPVSGRRLVTLRVPVIRGGTLHYVLSFAMAPDSVVTILKTAGAPPEWIGAVVDATNHVIARTIASEERAGELAGPALRQAIAHASSDTYNGVTFEGVPVETVFRRLPPPAGWTVAFGIPRRSLEVPVQRSLYILGGTGGAVLVLTALLTLLLAHDLAQRRRDERNRATAALSASEQRRALALDAADLGAWRWDIAADRFEGSARCRALLGLARQTPQSRAERWRDIDARMHPEDRELVDRAIRRCQQQHVPLQCEFRITEGNGAPRWLRMDGRLQDGGPGETRSMQGVIADITARRQAEADHLALLRRLAQAQEDERRRLSRELHDQVGQIVTGLSFGLKALELPPGDVKSRTTFHDQLRWLQSLTDEISREIHRTASDLRPTTLDDFGLQRAIETFAARCSEHYDINVDVQAIGEIGRMPSETETVVYRIIQEALNNVLKHAHARNVSVLLERTDTHLRVIVEDDGTGFDPDLIEQGGVAPHLGLSGIRERLSLVGGTVVMESTPGSGTSVFVHLPVQPAAPGPVA